MGNYEEWYPTHLNETILQQNNFFLWKLSKENEKQNLKYFTTCFAISLLQKGNTQ